MVASHEMEEGLGKLYNLSLFNLWQWDSISLSKNGEPFVQVKIG